MKKHTEHQDRHFSHYTAKYTKIAAGYMGQLMEWPEIVTEGNSLEECRTVLRDAVDEMIQAYQDLGKESSVGRHSGQA
ncbi:type II toxin-antitoxin system HicB family antitoxin [Candidatus Acetothermia bacterium]|nr:type II toxin-antitoxin system HicB family antitoxin [Candidatus Acetothermia bacterium]MBI3643062.1 type II toxin-antitoxin system HicB family antitoxin [Candidatus Acetothermia bacterium]